MLMLSFTMSCGDLSLAQNAYVSLFEESAHALQHCLYACVCMCISIYTITSHAKVARKCQLCIVHICVRCSVNISLTWRCCFYKKSKPVRKSSCAYRPADCFMWAHRCRRLDQRRKCWSRKASASDIGTKSKSIVLPEKS